jgi:two-component system, NarL family, nitrate/nitrite response regulator NarL
MERKETSIFLVDDHRIFLEGIAHLLSMQEGFKIVGYSASASEAETILKSGNVDVLITDIQMMPISGIELTRTVKNQHPEIKVLGLSMFDKPEIIHSLIDAGADGYLLKDVEIDELVDAITTVMDGKTFYSSKIADTLFKSIESKDLLTKREKEIIALIAKEKTNIEIADLLFISEYTVESHRKNIFRKTRSKSIVGLITYAYENKLI